MFVESKGDERVARSLAMPMALLVDHAKESGKIDVSYVRRRVRCSNSASSASTSSAECHSAVVRLNLIFVVF